MNTLAGLAAQPPLVLPHQTNALGTSVLYALKPHGLNTAFVESLTSLLRRLAAEHHERPSVLVREMIGAPYEARTGRPFPHATALSEAINGATAWTPELIEALVALTWVPEVRSTALGERVPGLYLRRSMRITRAWCPDCLQQSAYDRLVWSFSAYRSCVVHDRAMRTQCGSCGREHRALAAGVGPNRCPWCKAALDATRGKAQPAGDAERVLRDVVMHVASGQVITRAGVAGGVHAFLCAHGGMRAATELIGHRGATLSNPLATGSAFMLETLLAVLPASGETLADFLQHPAPLPTREAPSAPVQRRVSLAYLEPALRAALAKPDDQLTTLSAFAATHGVQTERVRLDLPDLARELVDRGSAWRAERNRRAQDAQLETILAIGRDVWAKNGRISPYLIGKELPKKGVLRSTRIQDAIDALEIELKKTEGEKR